MSVIREGRPDDLPSYPEVDPHGRGREPGSATGPPHWVTVVLIVVGVLVLLSLVLLHLSGGLGPGLHGGN